MVLAMTVIHFSTQISGGAGNFVKNVHVSMGNLDLESLIITRERSCLKDIVTIKPITRLGTLVRSRILHILHKIGLIDKRYSLFGIEKSPVHLKHIQKVLEFIKPTMFIFYWTSYFVSFKTILNLRQVYPFVPFVFVCTDEAFLTGGCHYSHGCLYYQNNCKNCPATNFSKFKNYINKNFIEKTEQIISIKPFIIYPTTNIQNMGHQSRIFRNIPSKVIPLGAISKTELIESLAFRCKKVKTKKVNLLVRSSYEYRKGCDLFVSSILKLNRIIPNLREILRIISIGDDMLSKSDLHKYVDFVDKGFVSRSILMDIYREIDVFLVSSREDGGPLMINECVSQGIFVISTPIGVAKDLIKDNINGFITQEVTSDAISDSLVMFLKEPHIFDFNKQEFCDFSGKHQYLTFEWYIKQIMDIVSMS